MNSFLEQWGEAAYTSLGFFWMALWAFVLGYFISGLIQVFVTEERMHRWMGRQEAKGVALGSFFGFLSSSCSFSAIATAKSLFQKGASFVASLAFLLASTNLVVELGILISIFLGWQFVVGEYVGGVLLILISWLLVRLLQPNGLIKTARQRLQNAEGQEQDHASSKRNSWKSIESWAAVGQRFAMEWQMVWKDVTVGFTLAGVISAFVPDAFFESLFWGVGTASKTASFSILVQEVLIAPLAAFLTFIGSMGNIPLAALLFGKGVSFAGVMAFIFSDLVVFPVLRIHAKYYGWKMAFFILFLLYTALVISALLLHLSFEFLEILPTAAPLSDHQRSYFEWDYTTLLNFIFLGLGGLLLYLAFYRNSGRAHHHAMASKSPLLEKVLSYLAYLGFAWLVIGLALFLLTNSAQ